ncbi:hypothetical protein I6E11_07545 [Bacteroides caecigallinarum]|uniref:GLUG motif-containing protein n=1 Tax=Bacteroides caecigallinarum TaxID=1411144 RepID=UPI001F3A8DA5|nr:GLUG motif-containing protein [Bacteroides caecigallinarum]MCF2593649.1 hypothetical protein [Bacteroides caecigallinarum]
MGGTIQNLGVKASYIKGGNRVGGLCGQNSGTVTNCYNTGNVAGTKYVGGVCGENYFGTVTNCYNTGSVTGTENYVGGVCGQNDSGTVTNCYNTGSVTGSNYIGGVCGQITGIMANCYNTGSVTGSNHIGGVCGLNRGTVTNCYYLTGTANSGIGSGSGEATAKTADEFKSGEVAFLLQDGQVEQVWGQLIGTDLYPVLGEPKVYNNNGTYSNMVMEGDYYLISTADELRLFASMVNGGQTSISAKLTADIVLNDIKDWESWETTAPTNSWTPIGSNIHQFTGTLDGDGHSISGIYINNSEEDRQGLVGYLGVGGTIQNLGVKASYIKGGNRVGGLCGQNSGTVTNCYNTGNVAGTKYVGGVCGENYSGTVTNCYNTGSVTGTENYVGGVCGQNDSGTVTNCYNTGSVTGSNYIGGVCGQITGIMANCYNTGSVTGSNHIGGVCGLNRGTVTNCYYLTGTANSGIGSGSGEATAKTADEFKSGEVASLLGEGWGQTIGPDDYPVLDADGTKRVYAVTLYQGSDAADARYLNSNGTFPTLTGNAIALVDADSPFKTGTNIVVKDGDSYTCAELVLTDGADFYTPVAFTATNATYTRSPKVWAANDGSGWETICLPFSGTLYADGDAKQPVLTDLAGDYWLRSLTDFETPNTLIFASGSTATAADHQIKAGVPYIIALPGTSFGSESLQGQTISVRGTNVTVTNEAQSVAAGSMFAFTGTFATKACDAASYRLNSENGSNGAGNLFVLDTNKLAPFRCRIDVIGLNIGGTSRSASSLPRELRIGQ